ncbi:hypothetical protein [Rufibacter latericius]|uniref:Uncharacterized protein n=1 Tax=Rufibacter latericius TaxID=2487040 RepID=A0A3M9ME16_9BACT|nr:hypothetical protein [Rufibacter latericius]RNI23445.1 hypothetical protein EFB08_18065 [Rufibacter latericius]
MSDLKESLATAAVSRGAAVVSAMSVALVVSSIVSEEETGVSWASLEAQAEKVNRTAAAIGKTVFIKVNGNQG